MNINTTHRSTWISLPNQCKRTSVNPSVIRKNARKEIRCLVALVISLYMYMTYMQILFLVHTVLADVYSLKSKRSGAVGSPPLETSAREIALLLSLMLEARARFFFFIIPFPRSLQFFRRCCAHQVLDVLVLLSCYELFFGQVPRRLP